MKVEPEVEKPRDIGKELEIQTVRGGIAVLSRLTFLRCGCSSGGIHK